MATSTTMGGQPSTTNDRMSRNAVYWIIGALVVLAVIIAIARNYQMNRETVIESTTVESTTAVPPAQMDTAPADQNTYMQGTTTQGVNGNEGATVNGTPGAARGMGSGVNDTETRTHVDPNTSPTANPDTTNQQ